MKRLHIVHFLALSLVLSLTLAACVAFPTDFTIPLVLVSTPGTTTAAGTTGSTRASLVIPSHSTRATVPQIPSTFSASSSAEATVTPTTTATKVPTTAPATAPTTPPQVYSAQGYRLLQTRDNGDALLKAYTLLAQGVEEARGEISLEAAGITLDEFTLVYDCYRNDYPQHFWWSGKYQYNYSPTTGQLYTLTPSYSVTGDALIAARRAFDAQVEAYLELLKAGMSDYEKELKLHDAIIQNCTYDMQAPNAYSAYGALVEGRAVCEGYAEAFQYLLHRAGINCLLITGWSNGQAHAWNAVQLGTDWYYTDVTWDDPAPQSGQTEKVYHGYFNLTLGLMNQDHIPEENILLPSADKLEQNYHHRQGTLVKDFDEKQVLGWLQQGLRIRVYVTGDLNAYIQDFYDSVPTLAGQLGLSGSIGYGYSACGRELELYISAN